MLDIQNVSYLVQATPWAPKQRILHDVSFSVPRGSSFGLLGPNGAGKTTLMKLMVGLTTPSRGAISIDGVDPHSTAIRATLGYLPEHVTLYPYLKGGELLNYAAELYGIPRATRAQRIAEVLDIVKMSPSADIPLRVYSKGMLQRIGLAQAILHKPTLLFLDEPLDGLDPVGRYEMKHILQSLKQDGTTMLLNSHILSDVETLCDTIGIIHHGELKHVGSVSAILQSNESLEAFFVKTIQQ